MSLGAVHLAGSLHLPIGVDMGSSSVTLAQVRLVERGSRDVRLVAIDSAKTPDKTLLLQPNSSDRGTKKAEKP